MALAWVLSGGEDRFAIPGTKKIHYLEENWAALNITLSDAERMQLDAAFPVGVASGQRYPQEMMKFTNF
jgi:aryl-alcohol dehydrogenase-like predicted oxidoreductase